MDSTATRHCPVRRAWLGFALCAGLAASLCAQAAPALAKPSDLFTLTNVWTVHLQFTPEQWAAMEPKGGTGGGGGGGRFGGGQRGGGRMDPATFLAPVFMKSGDQNQDAKLSQAEFQGLAEKWFGDWDKEKRGRLNTDQLRAGFATTIGMGGGGGGGRLQGAEGKRNGLASAMGIEFEYVHADLEFEGRQLKDVGVRYKGNGTFMQSRDSLKRSLKIDLNRHVKGQKLAGVTMLNLHNGVTDASWMNEVLSYRLYRDAGVPAPRTAYARVYITVPGKHDHQYFGLYSIVEDLDKHFADERFGTKKGAMFKPVTPTLFAYLGDDWAKYNQAYDPKTELSEAEKRRVFEFARLLTSASDTEFAAHVAEYLDLEEFARFLSVTTWLSTMDSLLAMGQNFYVYLHPDTKRFQVLPWDLDHSFGQFPMVGTQEQRENLSILKPWRGEIRLLDRVSKVDAFKELYLARMTEFSTNLFKPARFHQQVDALASAIRPAVQAESSDKLARFDKVVAGETVESGGMRRSGQPVKPIKLFADARAASVEAQLAGKSEGETIEGRGGFGGGGGAPGGGGFGGGGGRGGGGGGFTPGYFLANVILRAFDGNQDGEISRDEFTQGFAKWFKAWNTDSSGALSDEQLRAGISRDIVPFRGGQQGGPDFGTPGGRSRRMQ